MTNPYFTDTFTATIGTPARPAQVDAIAAATEAAFDMLPTPDDFDLTLRSTVTAGGTANAITVDNASDMSSYDLGQRASFKAIATNTAAATVNVDGLGAKSIKRQSGADVAAGDIVSGRVYDLIYDGTYFQLNGLTSAEANEIALAAATGTTLATGMATFLASGTSADLRGAVTDETGTGSLVFATAPTLTNPVVGTQSPGDNSTKAASTEYVDDAVIAGRGWTQIGSTITTTGGSVVDVTGIPQTYGDLLFIINGVSPGGAGVGDLQFRIGDDVSATSFVVLYDTISDGSTYYGAVIVSGYTKGAGIFSANATGLVTDLTIDAAGGQVGAWRISGGVQTFRLSVTGGWTFDAMSLKVFGR